MVLRKRKGHRRKKKRALLDTALLLPVLWLLVCKGCVFTEAQLREVGVVVVQWFNWRACCSGGGREQAGLIRDTRKEIYLTSLHSVWVFLFPFPHQEVCRNFSATLNCSDGDLCLSSSLVSLPASWCWVTFYLLSQICTSCLTRPILCCEFGALL